MTRLIYQHRNFALLLPAQVISLAGDALTEVALAVFALRIDHRSPLALGTVLFVGMLPRIMLGWVVAGLIDRWHKKRLMVAGDALRSVLVLSIPLIGRLSWALAAVFLIQTLGMFYLPAARAILPETVPKDQIQQANAALNTVSTILNVGGYGFAAFLVLATGPKMAFVLDAVTYLASAVMVLAMRLPRDIWQPRAGSEEGFWAHLHEGIVYHRTNRVVFDLLWISGIMSLAMYSLNVLAAPIATQTLSQHAGFYGFLMMAIAAGGTLGSQIMGRWGHKGSFRFWILLSLCLLTMDFLGFAATRAVLLVLLLFILAGLANALALVATRGWVMTATPTDFRGRVFAFRAVVIAGAGALSMVGAGFLAKVWTLPETLLIYAGISLVGWIGIALRPTLKEAARRLPEVSS